MKLEVMREDYDWRNAFSFAFDGTMAPYEGTCAIDCVEEVIAADDGDNDGPNWIAVVRLKDGRYAVISSGCDYTGWDCHAGGDAEYYDSLNAACSKLALTDEQRGRLSDQLVGVVKSGRLTLDWDRNEA